MGIGWVASRKEWGEVGFGGRWSTTFASAVDWDVQNGVSGGRCNAVIIDAGFVYPVVECAAVRNVVGLSIFA